MAEEQARRELSPVCAARHHHETSLCRVIERARADRLIKIGGVKMLCIWHLTGARLWMV